MCKHTWATEFPRVSVWVRVRSGYPQLTIYPRQLKNSGVLPTINLKQPIYSSVYPTINLRHSKYSGFRSTDSLKHLILSYSLKINRLDTRVFQLSRVYCQLWISHPYPYPFPRKFSCSCLCANTSRKYVDDLIEMYFLKAKWQLRDFNYQNDVFFLNIFHLFSKKTSIWIINQRRKIKIRRFFLIESPFLVYNSP